jgi:hypothetical protein
VPRLVEFTYRQHVRTVLKNNSVGDVARLVNFDICPLTDVYVTVRRLERETLVRRDGFDFSDREVATAHNVER